ncbi:DUF4132 domain-containing protein [Dactylosporangium sp. CS-033363]|uniref:DUF4132 domain-containing protein n=1 Tax=Dactylosporangium sp. CS-033363 TaxID=3239935 RepID=UPI003D91D7C6
MAPDTPLMVWHPGERDSWLSRAAALDHGREEPDWAGLATRAGRLSDLTPPQVAWLLSRGPSAAASRLLPSPLPVWQTQRIDLVRVAVARFELDALSLALQEAEANADGLGFVLLPFRAPEVAVLVAGWLRNLGSSRLFARLWLRRHAETAVRTLEPLAHGKPGRPRQNAEDALEYLSAAVLPESLLPPAMVAALGSEGRLPRWARSVRGTLTDDEATRLIRLLTRSRLAEAPEPAPGDPTVPVVVESSAAVQPLVAAAGPELERMVARCERASLAAFGRALLRAWLDDKMPAAESWVLLAQAHIGDDATMDELAPLIRSWPPKSRYARAIDGYAVLATVGSDAALRHLLAIAANMSGGAMNDRADDYLRQAAARRGLSPTQLADRLASTHGLDAGLTIDYGGRVFAVDTDEHLTPFATDSDGRRMARPPKPGAKDTNPDAYKQFQQLTKELRATAVAHTVRFEQDMLTRRLRPARDLHEVLLPHPILGPLARRLLWGERDRAFRVAEDGSFADVRDVSTTVHPDAQIAVVHPADLGADLAGWSQLLLDYEVLQPFPQVHRPVAVLTEGERAATSLAGFGPVATGRVDALLNGRRWHGNAYQTASNRHTQLAHPLPGGRSLLIELSPGVPTVVRDPDQPQWITEIWADDAWSSHWQLARRTPLGDCDPAALSELLVALFALKE